MRITTRILFSVLAMWCYFATTSNATHTLMLHNAVSSENAVTITAELADKYYGVDNTNYIHLLKYSITGMSEDVFSSGDIMLSYDGGTTWSIACGGLTMMNASMPILLPLDKDKVRYRIIVYPKDDYKDQYTQDELTYETADYDINVDARVVYSASKVVMNTGQFSGTDVNLSLLGVTKGGYQIWGCQGIDSHIYTQWRIDDGSKLSLDLYDFYSNTNYTLTTNYSATYHRQVPDGTQHYHFIKVKGQTSAEYITWYGTENFRPYSYYLYSRFEFAPTTDITYSKTAPEMTQSIKYALKAIDGKVLDNIAVMASTDHGKTWMKVGGMTSGFDEGTKEFTNTETVTIPTIADTVRYKIIATAKSSYALLADNGCWTYETEDYPVDLSALNCSLQVETPNRSTYTQDATTNVRTYDAKMTWKVLCQEMIDAVDLQCSTDNGNTWTTIGTNNNAEGTETMKIPVTGTRYLFRAVPVLKEEFADVDILNQKAEAEVAMTYDPIATLTISENTAMKDYEDQFHSITLNYTLNDDLWQTCEDASIAYSYDNGKSWMKLKSFTPSQTGEPTVTIDASEQQCKFRIQVKGGYTDANNYYTAETDNITFE